MGTRVVQIKCPSCGQAISGKAGPDLVYLCEGCGIMHRRAPDGVIEKVDYEITSFDPAKQIPQGATARVYMPAWKIMANVQILSEEVAGGFITKLATMFEGGERSGTIAIYVPGIELSAESFKYLATLLTSNPPVYRTIQKFEESVDRLPCVVSMEEATQLADFIVLSNEAEKPGVLQRISYQMTVQRQSLVFLAFNRGPGGELSLAV